MADWIVYVLLSRDERRTYVGVTSDLDRRIAQHNGELPGGARATRAGRPWRVGAHSETLPTRGEAQRMEAALKRRRGHARLTALLPAPPAPRARRARG